MRFWREGARTPWWWLCAVLGPALLAADIAGQIDGGVVTPATDLFWIAMAIAIVSGLWIWAWRPGTHMGPIMFWWPALWLMQDIGVAYPTTRLVSTIGIALYGMGAIAFAQMALSYPNGRIVSRLAWVYVFILGYLAQVIQNVVDLLYWDCPFCYPSARTYAYLGSAPFSLDTWNKGWNWEIIIVLPIGTYCLFQRYFASGPGARRTMGPLVGTTTVVLFTSWAQLFYIQLGHQQPLSNLSYVQNAGLMLVSFTAFLGLYFTRRARGAVGDLVVELGRARPGGVRDALARAIGDPSLELALWLPERNGWVDEAGRAVDLPEGRDRGVTLVGDDLAAIVHDPVFLDQPALLEAAGSAARFALENERLQAELRVQLAELRESRARIVRAGDEERRRLERDLHDGAQQRLLGVGMALQLLRSADPDDQGRLLDETEVEVKAALAELRELARGIHPAVLTDHGLAAAVRTLADRAPVPVEIGATEDRLPGEVETAVYFIVAEALANVAKHAHASKASVSVARDNGLVRVEVRDDGVGGAGLGSGTGLRGLADRAGALDGRLFVESPPGGGTRVAAEIPCAS